MAAADLEFLAPRASPPPPGRAGDGGAPPRLAARLARVDDAEADAPERRARALEARLMRVDPHVAVSRAAPAPRAELALELELPGLPAAKSPRAPAQPPTPRRLAAGRALRHMCAMADGWPFDRDVLRAAVLGRGGRPSTDWDLAPGGARPAPLPPARPLKPAAVLCGLVDRGDGAGWRVILTRRADHLRRHPGQVAFPGGRVDPEDPTPESAALREAEEEIGLVRDHVDLVGAIDPHETVTGYAVTPFVGFVDGAFAPRPDPSEVAEVFEPPLAFLMDPANRVRQLRQGPGPTAAYWAMPWEGRYIWGATARMLVSLSDRIAAATRERAG